MKPATTPASVRSREVHRSGEVRPRRVRPRGPHATAAAATIPAGTILAAAADQADHRRRTEEPVGPERPPAAGEAHDRAGQVVLPLGDAEPSDAAEHDGRQRHREQDGLERASCSPGGLLRAVAQDGGAEALGRLVSAPGGRRRDRG